ncbi:MAG: DMT family transporter, partial [Actinomycetota bacterium]|nr:DMT family transporter [Actinomycetota bacterium]
LGAGFLLQNAGVLLRAHLAVAAAGVLFGTTFVVVQDAVEHAGVVPFLAVRFLVGAMVLAPFARRAPRQPGRTRAGLVAGVVLLAGYVFQTVGLQYTTPPVSAFVTYLLVVIVPVLSALVLRAPPSREVTGGVVLALAGLVLLTSDDLGRVAVDKGELLTLGCAVAFAVHILVLSKSSPRFHAVPLTAVQLAFVGAACLVPGSFLGGYDFPVRVWAAAAYTGVTVSALAFLLQVWGQRVVGPTRTSLLLMLEPVAAAVLGYALGEGLAPAGAAGAVLILAGVAVAESPLGLRRARHS